MRTSMVEKRMKKMDKIVEDVFEPELFYYKPPNVKEENEKDKRFKLLIIGWGSTYWPIYEAVEKLEGNDVAFLYFKQLYPLHPETREMLENADKTVILENNAKGQFANLIKLETGFEIDKKVLKFNGMPFSVEEVIDILLEELGDD